MFYPQARLLGMRATKLAAFAVLLLFTPAASAMWIDEKGESQPLLPESPGHRWLVAKLSCPEIWANPAASELVIEVTSSHPGLTVEVAPSAPVRRGQCLHPGGLAEIPILWTPRGTWEVPAEVGIPVTFDLRFGTERLAQEVLVEMAYAGGLNVTVDTLRQETRPGGVVEYVLAVENRANAATRVTFEAQRVLAGTLTTPAPRLLEPVGADGSTAMVTVSYQTPGRMDDTLLVVHLRGASNGMGTPLGEPQALELVAATGGVSLVAAGLFAGGVAVVGVLAGLRRR